MKLPLPPLGAAALLVALVAPRAAHAQEPLTLPAAPQDTPAPTSPTPRLALVGSGIAMFGAAYAPAVVAAAASHLSADRALLVPLAGPWIDVAQRPGCAPTTSCNAENTSRVAIVIDGIFQGVGVLTVLGGFLGTSRVATTPRPPTVADLRPKVRLEPAQIGAGYGMLAVGSF